jgi:hypothetical protein
MIAAIAPPAESPATKTRSGAMPNSSRRLSVRPAMIAGSPLPRIWSLGRNQFQHAMALSPLVCAG